jgi:hypothetical protein
MGKIFKNDNFSETTESFKNKLGWSVLWVIIYTHWEDLKQLILFHFAENDLIWQITTDKNMIGPYLYWFLLCWTIKPYLWPPFYIFGHTKLIFTFIYTQRLSWSWSTGRGLTIGAAFTDSILAGISICVSVFCEELPHELGNA